MDFIISLVAERIRGLRDVLEISVEEMAEITGTTPEEYLELESGNSDFSFTFLYKCARRFGVDLTELLTGDMPTLSSYSLVRRGEGLPIKRRAGFEYQNLAFLFKKRLAEPFLVTAPYLAEEQNQPIHMSTHAGQECDYILSGSLKCVFDGHEEIVNAGDTVYYDSGKPHGMIATNGAPCVFLAFVMKSE